MISELVGHVYGKSLERIQKLSVGETASILQGLSRSGYMLKNSWNQNKVIDIFYKEHILNRIIAGNFSDDTLCCIYSVYNWKQLWCSAWPELHCLCRQLRFPPASTTSQSSCHTSPSYSWATPYDHKDALHRFSECSFYENGLKCGVLFDLIQWRVNRPRGD